MHWCDVCHYLSPVYWYLLTPNPHLVLSCSALPCLVFLCLALSCSVSPCLVLCHLSLSCLVVLSRCLALSCSASSFLALSCPLSLFSRILYFYCAVQADGSWETLECGRSSISGEYIVEEEPDESRPNGVTRWAGQGREGKGKRENRRETGREEKGRREHQCTLSHAHFTMP